MRILITGARGFLGLNMLRHMSEAYPEAQIVAVDLDEWSPVNQAVGQPFYRRLDVTDAGACCELMQSLKPTHILHAAAVTLTDESAASEELIYRVNLQGTKNVLGAAVAADCVQRVVLFSSSGIYDQSSYAGPCDEEHAVDLSSAYARTKRQAEMQMAEYEDRGGFAVVAARIGPVYGEFEQARTTRPDVSLIQKLLDHLEAKRPICVTGTDMHRDWTHAADFARALDLLLFAPNLNHRIYNVSSGASVSASSILDLFIGHGLNVSRVNDAEMADIVLRLEQSRKPLIIERLKQDTGFSPSFDIGRGLTQIIAARQQHIRELGIEEIAAR